MTNNEFDGHAVFRCPHCAKAGTSREDCLAPTVSTERAMSRWVIPNGLRFLGVPCDTCEKTYTVEVVKEDGA